VTEHEVVGQLRDRGVLRPIAALNRPPADGLKQRFAFPDGLRWTSRNNRNLSGCSKVGTSENRRGDQNLLCLRVRRGQFLYLRDRMSSHRKMNAAGRKRFANTAGPERHFAKSRIVTHHGDDDLSSVARALAG